MTNLQPVPLRDSSSALSDPQGRTRVLCLVDGLVTAEVGSCCVLLWRAEVNDPRFQIQREALEHVTSRYPGQASVLCIIEPASEPPSQELREAASQLLTDLGSKIRCIAYVVEGSGFRAAMIRGVLSSVELLRRGKQFPSRYFANVAHASAWLSVETGMRSADLVESSAYMRRRLDSISGRRPSVRASGARSWPQL